MRTYLVVLLACALSATAWSAEEATHDSAKVIATAKACGWEGVLYTDLPDCAEHPWVAAQLC